MTQIKGERMDKNVYAAIQSQYATFSKVGKRIADHIIADPVHITSISIQQMAEVICTGSAMIWSAIRYILPRSAFSRWPPS